MEMVRFVSCFLKVDPRVYIVGRLKLYDVTKCWSIRMFHKGTG